MATKAATGGNSQPVRWIVVEDAEKRRRLGEIYRRCWAEIGALYRQRTPAEVAHTHIKKMRPGNTTSSGNQPGQCAKKRAR